MNKLFTTVLDEALRQLCADVERTGLWEPNVIQAKQTILAAVEQLVTEVIGEDEHKIVERPVIAGSVDPSPTGTLPGYEDTKVMLSNNQLRVKQLQRLAALLKGEQA